MSWCPSARNSSGVIGAGPYTLPRGAERSMFPHRDMSRLEQDDVGSCSFVDVLEEAVLVRRPVAIELRDGTTFIDQVTDVTTESGQDFAVFRSHARVPVKDIAAATRAEPPRRPSPEP